VYEDDISDKRNFSYEISVWRYYPTRQKDPLWCRTAERQKSVVGDAGPEATRLDHYRHLDISNLFDGRNGMQNFACHECQALKFVRMPGTDSERH
jgi:hypothetical protein